MCNIIVNNEPAINCFDYWHRIDYFDLAGLDPSAGAGDANVNERSAYSTKKFSLEGVTVYSDEFAVADKTMSRSSSPSSGDGSSSVSDSLPPDGSCHKKLEKGFTNLVLCGKLSGRHEASVRLKQCETLAGPKVRCPTITQSLSYLFSIFLQRF